MIKIIQKYIRKGHRDIGKSFFQDKLNKDKRNSPNYRSKKSIMLLIDEIISKANIKNVIIIVFFNIILLILYLLPINIPLLNHVTNNLTQYSTIISGLIAIILGLLIFITESLRDKYSETHSVLIYESKILFTTITLLCHSFFSFFQPLNTLLVIGTAGLIFLTLFSLYKVILLFTNKSVLIEKRAMLLSNQINESLDIELNRRIGNAILSDFIEENRLNFTYSYYPSDELDNFFFVKSPVIGIITDIDLDALKRFSEKIEHLNDEHNNTVSENQQTQTENNSEKVTIYFNKVYYDKVTGDDKELFRISKKIISEETFMSLMSLALSIFKIENERNTDDIIKTNLKCLNEDFIMSIRNGYVGKVESLTNTYIFIIEEFLKRLINRDGIYNSEKARSERQRINNGFKQLDWLGDGLRQIILEVNKTKNEHFLFQSIHILRVILSRAMHSGDHLLFQQFINLSEYLYLITEETDIKWRKLVVTHISRFINDIRLYCHIVAKKQVKLEDVYEYVRYLYRVLQSLLKSCYDNSDADGFNKFLCTVNDLNYNYSDFSQIYDDVEKSKFVMLYYLKSWIFRDIVYQENATNWEFFNAIDVFENISLEEFISVYAVLYSTPSEQYWGSYFWDVLGSDKKIVVSSDTYYSYNMFFVYQCLVIISAEKKKGSGLPNLEVFVKDDLKFNIKYEAGFRKILKDSRTKFCALGLNIYESTVNELLKIMEDARDTFERKERDEIIEKEISDSAVEEFKLNFINAFEKNAKLRNLIIHYTETFEDKKNEIKEGLSPRDMYFIQDKRLFIQDSDMYYTKVGLSYGASFARSEDSDILRKIIERAKSYIIDFRDLNSLIADETDLFIITNRLGYKDFFITNEYVINKWNSSDKTAVEDIMAFEGKYVYGNNEVPIFLFNNDEVDGTYIFIKNKFGQLKQYSPLVKENQESDRIDIFSIRVDPYLPNGELLNNLIQSPPEWLASNGTESEQIQFLMDKVRIMIYECYEFIFSQDFKGYSLKKE